MDEGSAAPAFKSLPACLAASACEDSGFMIQVSRVEADRLAHHAWVSHKNDVQTDT